MKADLLVTSLEQAKEQKLVSLKLFVLKQNAQNRRFVDFVLVFVFVEVTTFLQAAQIASLRSSERAANDEKLRLASRVRALETAAKIEEERSSAFSGGGSSNVNEGQLELLRVDVAHAQRRAEEAEKHEKRANDELREERRQREAADQRLGEAERRERRLRDESSATISDLERKCNTWTLRAEEAEARVRALDERLARLQHAALTNANSSLDSSSSSIARRAEREDQEDDEKKSNEQAALQLAEARAKHAEQLAADFEARLAKVSRELERETRARQAAEEERPRLAAAVSSSGNEQERLVQQHQREITLLNEQLNAALRDAANAKLALRVRAATSSSPTAAAPSSPSSLSSPPPSSPPSALTLPAPSELLGSDRRRYKLLVRAGKDARDAGDARSALQNFQAAANLATDEKLARTIEKLKQQL